MVKDKTEGISQLGSAGRPDDPVHTAKQEGLSGTPPVATAHQKTRQSQGNASTDRYSL